MFKKSFSLLLALVLTIGVWAAVPVEVSATKKKIASIEVLNSPIEMVEGFYGSTGTYLPHWVWVETQCYKKIQDDESYDSWIPHGSDCDCGSFGVYDYTNELQFRAIYSDGSSDDFASDGFTHNSHFYDFYDKTGYYIDAIEIERYPWNVGEHKVELKVYSEEEDGYTDTDQEDFYTGISSTFTVKIVDIDEYFSDAFNFGIGHFPQSANASNNPPKFKFTAPENGYYDLDIDPNERLEGYFRAIKSDGKRFGWFNSSSDIYLEKGTSVYVLYTGSNSDWKASDGGKYYVSARKYLPIKKITPVDGIVTLYEGLNNEVYYINNIPYNLRYSVMLEDDTTQQMKGELGGLGFTFQWNDGYGSAGDKIFPVGQTKNTVQVKRAYNSIVDSFDVTINVIAKSKWFPEIKQSATAIQLGEKKTVELRDSLVAYSFVAPSSGKVTLNSNNTSIIIADANGNIAEQFLWGGYSYGYEVNPNQFCYLIALPCDERIYFSVNDYCDSWENDYAHNFTNYKVTTTATHTTVGKETGTCACGEEQTRTIAKTTAHSFGTWQTTTAATCTTTGTQTRTCSCGDKQTQSIAALGHSYGAWTVTKAATCTATGTETRTCSRNTSHKETRSIAKKAHKLKTTTTKATAKKAGKTTTQCTACKKVTKTTAIPKIKSVKLAKTSYVYTGKAIAPKVTVTDSKGKRLINGTDYTITYQKGRKNVGQYSVTVKFKGKYSGTSKKTFKILPKATSVSKLTAKAKGFTVNVKKQATQTTGYEIQYSTSQNFTKKTRKTTTITKNSTTSKNVSKLSAKKKYFVRVRTYKTVKVNGENVRFYSAWSGAKAVTTK